MIAQPIEASRTLKLVAEAAPIAELPSRSRARNEAATPSTPDRPRAGARHCSPRSSTAHRTRIGVADPGCAGARKSALVGGSIAELADRPVTVLRASGIRTEANLPYAGLHQLLRPVLGELGSLPRPQRRAIEAAFGISMSPAPDQSPDRDRDAGSPLHRRAPEPGRRRGGCSVAGPADERGSGVRGPAAVVGSHRAHRHLAGRPALPILDAGLAELNLEGLGDDEAGRLLATWPRHREASAGSADRHRGRQSASAGGAPGGLHGRPADGSRPLPDGSP